MSPRKVKRASCFKNVDEDKIGSPFYFSLRKIHHINPPAIIMNSAKVCTFSFYSQLLGGGFSGGSFLSPSGCPPDGCSCSQAPLRRGAWPVWRCRTWTLGWVTRAHSWTPDLASAWRANSAWKRPTAAWATADLACWLRRIRRSWWTAAGSIFRCCCWWSSANLAPKSWRPPPKCWAPHRQVLWEVRWGARSSYCPPDCRHRCPRHRSHRHPRPWPRCPTWTCRDPVPASPRSPPAPAARPVD